MIYKLESMLQIQNGLNKVIQATQNLSRENTRCQSHLCIMIEMMELCNSTRCFNYWSKKKRQEDADVLEEFADVLCFLLIELLELDINSINFDETIQCENNLELTLRFQNLVKLYNELSYEDVKTYKLFSEKFFELGYALGYNIEMIYDAYKKKVDKNYGVQKQFKDGGQ